MAFRTAYAGDGGRARTDVEDPLGLAQKLSDLVSNGWGAFAIALVVIAYLFRELRKSEAARLSDSEAERKALQEQNKVLQRVADVVAQLNSSIPPRGTHQP